MAEIGLSWADMLGIDTGGTFTDFVYFDGQELRVHKVLSTPEAPERAILQGLREMSVSLEQLRIVHGSTVATNALLEKKGVSTAYITNRGFADVLTIGRQARRELYQLQPAPVSPPVPPDACIETGGRLAADGTVIEPLTEGDIADIVRKLAQIQPRAVAINLLFSFIDDGFEKKIEHALADRFFVSRSSAILPEPKEYERGMATWMNAYVSPLMQQYLHKLADKVAPARLKIMLSSGGTANVDYAGQRGVDLLLSGPAGGVAAAQYLAETLNIPRLLTFDMGGTSTDVGMIDGELKLTDEAVINGYAVAVPMVDIHTIGAGGGSLAAVDRGGMLTVGPESAGANPGPACYGKGGNRPTVTDANVVLGRLPASSALAGKTRLNATAAYEAIQPLAALLNLSVAETALGIVRLANEHMVRALRVMSAQRGYNPAHFTLLSFGGAGGLHVCALADALNMKRAIVPRDAGVFCAFGMLCAPPRRELTKSFLASWRGEGFASVEKDFSALEARGRAELAADVTALNELTVKRSVEMRYRGQSYTLNVPWTGTANTVAQFHATHTQRFGHSLNELAEVVNLRVSVSGPRPSFIVRSNVDAGNAYLGETDVFGIDNPVPMWRREALPSHWIGGGPLLILEYSSTIFVAPQWCATVDGSGHLILTRK